MAKERLTVTQGLCDKVGKLTIRGLEPKEIVDILGISQATVSRIQAANFDLEQFKANNEKRREKEKNPRIISDYITEEVAKKASALPHPFNEEEMLIPDGRGQLPGQLTMDLPKQDSEKDQAAMMRFLAGKNDENKKLIIAYMDALAVKLSAINDTLCQILRAVSGK